MSQTLTITVDELIPHPPEVVWPYLVEPERLARWWAPNDIAPVVGHRFTLDMGQWGQAPCTVLAVEPGRSISFTFAEGSQDTTITWRLEAEGTSTRLFLEHAGFDPDDPMSRTAFDMMGPGWKSDVLPRLPDAIAADRS